MARRNHPDLSVQRLATLRRQARAVLTLETLATAALIPIGIVALFLILTLLGAGGWQTSLLGLIALIAATALACRNYRTPHPATIDRRIEHDSHLPHRPIAAYEDRPALIEPRAAALWQSHRARLDTAILTATVNRPHPDLAAHDPYALRYLSMLALIAAAIAAGPQAIPRLAASLTLPSLTLWPPITLQTWITPPRWTGRPPHLITPGPTPIPTLTGASLALIATGAGTTAPAAHFANHTLHFTTIDTGSYRTSLTLTAPGTLTIGPFWHRLATYHLAVTAPTPPTIRFAAPPHAHRQRIALSWHAHSAYALTRLTLRFHPDAPAARPESAPIPTGRTLQGHARLSLIASPYAGLPVTARLIATNRASLTGHSATARFVLPIPTLHNKTAQALESIRRTLALTPSARPALAQALTAIATAPPGPITRSTQRAITRFAPHFAADDAKAAHPETSLWTLVQRAEQGAAFRAAQQLAAARHALEQALRKAVAGKSLDNAALQKLLAQLNQSAQAHLAAQNHSAPSQSQAMQMSAIDQLAQKIAQESAAGRTAQARRDLAKLKKMLQQLQNAKPPSAAAQARQQAAGQAAKALSQLMRQEAKLMDRTARQNPNTPPPMGTMANQRPTQRSQALAAQQRALQRRLQATSQSMAQSGLNPGPQLAQGQTAMQGAKAQLQMGNRPGAIPAEQAAIAALQQAQGALAAMQTGHGTGGGPSGAGQHAAGGHGEFGNQSHSTISLGRAGAHSDARSIQNRLIRRDASPDLPPTALQYYHRLLGDRF